MESSKVVSSKTMLQRNWTPSTGVPTKASEVLSGALEFWGKGGARWVTGTIGALYDSGHGTACLIGGIQVSGLGDPTYDPGYLADYITPQAQKITKKAMKYVLDELEARGFARDIIEFNDGRTYNFNSARRLGTRKGFPMVHAIVCGALKRAIADEEKEE